MLFFVLLGVVAAGPRAASADRSGLGEERASGAMQDSGRVAAWPPFVRIVPQPPDDGAIVFAEGIGNSYSSLSAEFFSPTSHNWGHTSLDYQEDEELYRGRIEDVLFEPCSQPGGCLYLSPPDSSRLRERPVAIFYEFRAEGPDSVPDLVLNTARLRFADPPFTDRVTHTVVLLVPPRDPAPLPAGWQILGGGLYVVESDGPHDKIRARLSISYDPDLLASYGVNPLNLRIFRWVASQRAGEVLESRVFVTANSVSASVEDLTAYALAMPTESRLWLPLAKR